MEDIIGKKFGKLTVLEVFYEKGRKYCKYRCECGNEKISRLDNLIRSKNAYCGCLDTRRKNRSYPPLMKSFKEISPNEIEEKKIT